MPKPLGRPKLPPIKSDDALKMGQFHLGREKWRAKFIGTYVSSEPIECPLCGRIQNQKRTRPSSAVALAKHLKLHPEVWPKILEEARRLNYVNVCRPKGTEAEREASSKMESELSEDEVRRFGKLHLPCFEWRRLFLEGTHDTREARCELCGYQPKASATKPYLRDHFRVHHPTLWKRVRNLASRMRYTKSSSKEKMARIRMGEENVLKSLLPSGSAVDSAEARAEALGQFHLTRDEWRSKFLGTSGRLFACPLCALHTYSRTSHMQCHGKLWTDIMKMASAKGYMQTEVYYAYESVKQLGSRTSSSKGNTWPKQAAKEPEVNYTYEQLMEKAQFHLPREQWRDKFLGRKVLDGNKITCPICEQGIRKEKQCIKKHMFNKHLKAWWIIAKEAHRRNYLGTANKKKKPTISCVTNGNGAQSSYGTERLHLAEEDEEKPDIIASSSSESEQLNRPIKEEVVDDDARIHDTDDRRPDSVVVHLPFAPNPDPQLDSSAAVKVEVGDDGSSVNDGQSIKVEVPDGSALLVSSSILEQSVKMEVEFFDGDHNYCLKQ